MSELSIHELEAEQVEVLPERETLGALLINQEGAAEANQLGVAFAINNASVSQHANVVALGSFDTHIFAL